jgi:hypothetical protein
MELSLVPQLRGGEEIRAMVLGALDCRRRAMEVIAETIQRMVQVGRRLVQVKTLEVDHGAFKAWMVTEGIVGEGETQINYRTAVRWMGLARFDEKHAGQLESAGTIMAAYRLAGLLPDPDSPTKKPAAQTNHVQAIARIERDIEEQLKTKPLDQMPRPELEALAAVLDRLSELRTAVQARLGTPPTKESLYQAPDEGSKRLPALSYE